MTQLKAVIFDMDGLIFDTEHLSTACWKKTGEAFGVPITEDFLRWARGMTRIEYKVYFESYFGNRLDYQTVMDYKIKLFWEILERDGIIVKPGVADLLKYLKNNGIPFAIATASLQLIADRYLELGGLEKQFTRRVYGEPGTKGKPDPEIFLKAAALLGQDPSECMVLEDSINGVNAGLNGGFITVMVPDIAQPEEALKKRIFLCCNTLLDLIPVLEAGKKEKEGKTGIFL